MERSKPRLWLCLLVLAGIVRGGWLAADCRSLRPDPDTYRQLARQLLADGTFGHPVPGDATAAPRLQPTAYRPPLYPLVLVAFGWVDDVGSASIAILHAMAGVATVLLVYRLSQAWQLGGWGWWAAVLVACDPILLNQSSRVMTETPATLLAVLGLLGLTRLTVVPTISRALLAGVLVALAVLCRPTFLVWGAAIAVAILLTPQSPFRRRLWLAGSFVLAGCVVTAPWAVRNVLVFERLIVTTTHGGYTLWLGNNEEFYGFLDQARWGDVWDSQRLDEQYLRVRREFPDDELRADRWAYEQGVATIRRHPGSFVKACVFRVGSLWGLVPHQVEAGESAGKRFARYAVGAWYAAVSLLALVGAGFLGRKLFAQPWLWGLMLCLSFTLVHVVYWSNLRMRAPLMPVVCLAAAVGVRAITSRTWRPRAGNRR